MSVFSKINDFLRRHRTKLVVSGVIFGGALYLNSYAQRKLKEWHEKQTLDFLERNRKQLHFESIGRICNQTVVDLSKSLIDTIIQTIDTAEIVAQIEQNPSNKLDLWNELKMVVFCKAACTIYSTAMLVVTLKIQLSVLGGYLYKDANALSSEVQEKYLSLCKNLFSSSFRKLHQVVENNCKKVLAPVELKKELKLGDLETIFWSIETGIAIHNDNPVETLRHYIIPDIPETSGTYESVLRDTVDLLESDEVKSLITHCINRGFVLLVDQMSEYFNQNNNNDSFSNVYSVKKHMVKILPIMNSLITKKFKDVFLQQLLTYEKLQTLSANVYESLL